MFEKPVTPADSSSEDLLDARKKFEAEKLTRRSALKKFGITSGMALFGMFAADDLARMVIKKMEENEATHQIAETVAHEFKNSGIAFASPPGTCPLPGCCAAHVNVPTHVQCCRGSNVGGWCNFYPKYLDCVACCNGTYNDGGWCGGYFGTPNDRQTCINVCQGIPAPPGS